MLHDKDKHTSKCCPFLACCFLQFFLLTIYKPLLYNIDELQKWWSRSLISVKCTRAVYLLMRYRVISVKCINVCAGQINIWHPISLYTGIPVSLSCADPTHSAVRLQCTIFYKTHDKCSAPKSGERLKVNCHCVPLVSLRRDRVPPKKRRSSLFEPLDWAGSVLSASPPCSPSWRQGPGAAPQPAWERCHFSKLPGITPGLSQPQALQAKGKFCVELPVILSPIYAVFTLVLYFFVIWFLWFSSYNGFYIKEFSCSSENCLSSDGHRPVALFWCRFKNFFSWT